MEEHGAEEGAKERKSRFLGGPWRREGGEEVPRCTLAGEEAGEFPELTPA